MKTLVARVLGALSLSLSLPPRRRPLCTVWSVLLLCSLGERSRHRRMQPENAKRGGITQYPLVDVLQHETVKKNFADEPTSRRRAATYPISSYDMEGESPLSLEIYKDIYSSILYLGVHAHTYHMCTPKNGLVLYGIAGSASECSPRRKPKLLASSSVCHGVRYDTSSTSIG